MPVRDMVLDEPREWRPVEDPVFREMGFVVKRYADGTGELPYAVLSVQPPGYVNPAHFHDADQFQVVLEGTIAFPVHRLRPLSVHYSDSGLPYGPFEVGDGVVLGIFRQRSANQIYMSDREGRRQRNAHGRESYCVADDVAWQQTGDGSEVKHLVALSGDDPDGSDAGPSARLMKVPADGLIGVEPAPAGQYQIVVDGSVADGDRRLEPYAIRYHVGDEAPSALVAGSDGATVLVLTFDTRGLAGAARPSSSAASVASRS